MPVIAAEPFRRINVLALGASVMYGVVCESQDVHTCYYLLKYLSGKFPMIDSNLIPSGLDALVGTS